MGLLELDTNPLGDSGSLWVSPQHEPATKLVSFVPDELFDIIVIEPNPFSTPKIFAGPRSTLSNLCCPYRKIG
jgi:hypothetical protein